MEERALLEKKDSGFHTMSFKNYNFRTFEEEGGGRSEVDVEVTEVTDLEMENDTMYCDVGVRKKDYDYGNKDGSNGIQSLRRHSDVDGNREERKSLLCNEHHQRIGASTGNILNLKVGTIEPSHMRIGNTDGPSPAHSSSCIPQTVSNMLSHDQTIRQRHSGQQDAIPQRPSSSLTDTPPQDTEEHTVERKKVLQRELSRIQRELQSLGDLEIEVSYV